MRFFYQFEGTNSPLKIYEWHAIKRNTIVIDKVYKRNLHYQILSELVISDNRKCLNLILPRTFLYLLLINHWFNGHREGKWARWADFLFKMRIITIYFIYFGKPGIHLLFRILQLWLNSCVEKFPANHYLETSIDANNNNYNKNSNNNSTYLDIFVPNKDKSDILMKCNYLNASIDFC